MTELEVYETVARHLKKYHPDLYWRFDTSGVHNPSAYSRALYSRLNPGRGHPDLFIAKSTMFSNTVNPCAGLFIEIKAPGTRLSRNKQHIAEQKQVLDKLASEGYYTAMAIGSDETLYYIHEYLGDSCAADIPEEGFEF